MEDTVSAQENLDTPLVQSSQFDRIKNSLIKGLIVCLVAAAGLAVVAVLLGSLSGIVSLSLETLAMAMVHAIAALAYVNTGFKSDDKKELIFFSNTVFVVIILSLITSVLGIWHVLIGDIVGKLYLTYFIILFGTLHANMLHQASGKTTTIDAITNANYFFMVGVIILLLVIVYSDFQTFGAIYYRILAAAGIVDATLTILAVAMHRLYLNQHPEEASSLFAALPHEKRRTSPFLILFGVYLAIQIIASFLVVGIWR